MLHFFHVFSTFDAGGLEVRAIQLMELLGERARHTVVSLDGKVGAKIADPSGNVIEIKYYEDPSALRGERP